MRRARIGAAAGATLAALLIASSAQAAWQYRGEVADGHHTTFQLIVRHGGGDPTKLLYFASGRLHLSCKGGGHRRSALTDNFGPLDLFGGQFGLEGTEGLSGRHGEIRVKRFVVKGTIRRHHAAGDLSFRMRIHHHHCRSGHLRWHADFVPRAG